MWSIVLQCGAYNQWIAYWRIRLVNYIHTSWRYYVQLWQCGRVVVWCIKWFDYVHTIRSVDYIHTSSYYYAQPSQYDQSCCSVVHSICGFHNGKKNRKHTKHQKKKSTSWYCYAQPRQCDKSSRPHLKGYQHALWRPVYPHMWHDSFIYVTLLLHICDMTHSYVWHDSFIYVTWLIHICDITHSRACLWVCEYMWHDSFIYVTWVIHLSDMTNSYLWHYSLTCVFVSVWVYVGLI